MEAEDPGPKLARGSDFSRMGVHTVPRLCNSASAASALLTHTPSWREPFPPWCGLNGTRGPQSATRPSLPLPSVKDGKTKPQKPEEEARDLIKSPHPAGGSGRKCLFSFQRCGMLRTGTGGPAFPDSVAQGPEMTSVREALRMAEGLRGGRCRVLRRADSCTFPACRARRCRGTLGTPMWKTACQRKPGGRGELDVRSRRRALPRRHQSPGPWARHLAGGGRPASPDVTAGRGSGVTPRYCPNSPYCQ